MRIILIIACCLLFSPAAFAQTEKAPQNKKTLDFSLTDINGKTVSLKDFRGKIVLLNFWATWCPPCRAEIPELVKWQREYQSQNLQIVGVTHPPTNRAGVRRFVQKNKINYPILFGTKKIKALFNSSDALPLTIVIDGEGNVKDSIEGIVFPEEFDEKIKPLLKPFLKKIQFSDLSVR